MNRSSDYKETNIDWIGKIPNEWSLKPLFSVASENKNKNSDNSETVLSLSYGKIKLRDLSKNKGILPENFDSYQVVKDGYIIIRSTDLQNDKKSLRVGLVTQEGVITSAYLGLIPKESLNSNYFYHYLHACDIQKVFYGLGGGVRQSLGFEDFKRYPVPLPSLEEQSQIVKFLEKKLSQIDSLIEKTERKIELLKEQQTATINHYVTKGLDPNVEMKDSGIKLIGEIPKHWKVLKIKHVVNDGGFRSGPFGSTLITSQLSVSGDWIVYSPENLRSNDISDQLYVPDDRKEELAKYLVKVNDIVLPIVGSLNVSKVITENDQPGIINQRLCRISLDPQKVNIHYISFLFKHSNLIQNQIETEKKGSILDHITREIIFNFLFPSPPEKKERDQLFEKVYSTNENFRVLIDRNQLKINLLREYRQSLISSVVTGKLRVTEEMA